MESQTSHSVDVATEDLAFLVLMWCQRYLQIRHSRRFFRTWIFLMWLWPHELSSPSVHFLASRFMKARDSGNEFALLLLPLFSLPQKVDWLSFPSSPLAATEVTAETPPPSCSVLTAWRPRVTAVRPRQAAVVFQAPPMLVIVLGIQIPCAWNQGVGAYGVGLKLREPAWCLPCCDDLIMGWSRGLRYIANSQQHGVPLNQGNLQRAHS